MPDIPTRRLIHQQLDGTTCQSPEQVVAWLGAVQAQEYDSAKWALGLRLPSAKDSWIEQAFTEGKILRTHIMRPTWHFVTPTDLRWLQKLTAHRVKLLMGHYNRKLELDADVFRRSNAAIVAALEGGNQLTRAELAAALANAGIRASGQRLAHLVFEAELDCLICSGPRRGKQFTYMLVEERVPQARALHHEEALAELTRRYFASHGPAQVKDFAWWSGLTQADCKEGMALLSPALEQETVVGKTYYWAVSDRPTQPSRPSPSVYLLPNYDEYGIGYTDRDDVVDSSLANEMMFSFVSGFIVVNGRVAGLWKRTFDKKTAVIAVKFFRPITQTENAAIREEVRRYGEFFGVPARLSEG